MVETPECKKIFNPTKETLVTSIFPLLNDGYDVVVRRRDLDILICPIQKEKR